MNDFQTLEWIKCSERIPESKDDSVLVYFPNGSIETVHIQDYFDDITAGYKDGILQYTKWYLSQGITHWMELPNPPKGE